MIILRLLTVRSLAGAGLDLTVSFDDEFIEDVSETVPAGKTVVLGSICAIHETSFAVIGPSGHFAPKVDVGRDTPAGVVQAQELADGDGNRIQVRYRVDDVDVALAPEVELRPQASSAKRKKLSVSRGSESTNTSVSDRKVLRYIAQPLNYTGDKWHIALALLLDPDCKVVILHKGEKVEAGEMGNFYTDLGIQEDRVLFGQAKRGMQQIHPNYWPKRAAEYAQKDAKQHNRDAVTKMTFASTSIIMHAVEEQGVEAVRKKVQDAFVEVIHRKVGAERRKQLDARIAFLESGGPYVLVNMRCSHYHHEHNVTRAIYEQIEHQARVRRLTVVRVGIYEPDFDNHQRFGAWMEEFRDCRFAGPADEQRFVDVYGYREKREGYHADEFETAYLWLRIAALGSVVGIIGGRSGSLDVAAFMGVRTLSWDIVDNEREYVRMLLAFPLMSCIRRVGLGDGTGRPGKQDEPTGELLAGTLEPLALELWLGKAEVIPEHYLWNRLPRTVLEKELEFDALHYLDRLLDSPRPDAGAADDEQGNEGKGAQLVEPPANEGEFDDESGILRTNSYGSFRKGKAADDGNCFFESLWKVLPVEQRPGQPGDLRARLAGHYRQNGEGADAERVRGDGVYVSVDDIGELAEALGIPLVTHFRQYGHARTVAQEHNPGGMAPLHFLFEVDPDQLGHVSPLHPA